MRAMPRTASYSQAHGASGVVSAHAGDRRFCGKQIKKIKKSEEEGETPRSRKGLR